MADSRSEVVDNNWIVPYNNWVVVEVVDSSFVVEAVGKSFAIVLEL